MRLKERERSTLFINLKKTLRYLWRGITNRKSKIFAFSISLIILFFVGLIFGLLISGFFGTFDEPSERALNFVRSTGLSNKVNLGSIKNFIKGLWKENIKIPLNFINGILSKPEKIAIDITFTDYQKLEYKRQQAFETGFLLSSSDDYVPIDIIYNGEIIPARIRLKGDKIDNLQGDKWSFRIKIRGENTLFGMKAFSIQNPRARNYFNEFIYHKALKREGIIALRYDFIEVSINGEKKGIFAIEEHFDKRLIEDNNRVEGVILKFDEDWIWEEYSRGEDYFSNYLKNNTDLDFYQSKIETFDNEDMLQDPRLSLQFEKARNLLEGFRQRRLKTHQVFDIDKLVEYFAINVILGAEHASHWTNIRFYYNPLTSRLEPIGSEGESSQLAHEALEQYFPNCLDVTFECSENKGTFYDLVFKDPVFFEKYMKRLDEISQGDYLDNLFLELDEEIKTKKNILYKDNPFYFFNKEIYYANQRQIRERLDPVKSINVYLDENALKGNKLIVIVENIDSVALEMLNLDYNGRILSIKGNRMLQPKDFSSKYNKFEFEFTPINPSLDNFTTNLSLKYKMFGLNYVFDEPVSLWSPEEKDFIEKDFIRQESNKDVSELLSIDTSSKRIFVNRGTWTLNQSLIFPKGYSVFAEQGTIINLVDNSIILSHSNLQFIGTENSPIKIISSDNTGQGLVVLNADKQSNLENVVFEGLTSASKEGWELTGAVSFHESPVKLNKVSFKNINAEDSLNLVNSEFEITNVVFENCYSDCFDDDYSEGIIKDSVFNNCVNDCVDVSKANVELINLDITDIGDKGISAGEQASLIIKNLNIDSNFKQNFIGVASKDQSEVIISDSYISNCEYGLAVYQKKSEYGPGYIEAKNIEIVNSTNKYILESKSELIIDDKIILGNEKEVYDTLYTV
tara:strand:+ start:2558 stop:5290 length:2733 start_codon:yes stop_codon:yes gene_type:complete